MASPCCVSGTVHDGTPRGHEEKVYGLDTYTTSPADGSSPNGIVVIIPDALGWSFNNTRLMADRWADRGGFKVYLPEFMDGNAMDPGLMVSMNKLTETGLFANLVKPYYLAIFLYNLIPFLYRTRRAVCAPLVQNFFTALRPSTTLPIGAAGFCWGGYYTFHLCATSLVDCGFTAHPSNVTIPTDVEAVTRPISVAIGTEDMIMPIKEVRQMEGILQKKKGEVESEVVVFEGAKHGFSTRMNPGNPEEKKQADESDRQAVEWYTRWFKK